MINQKYIKRIIKIFLLVILFFGSGVFRQFATDTYWEFAIGWDKTIDHMLFDNGRPVIALMFKLYSLTHLKMSGFYKVSSFFAIIFLTLALVVLENILSRYIENENTRILISFATIVNAFIVEYFMFFEKAGFMLAILFVSLAVYFMESFFRTKIKKDWLFSVSFIFLAIFTYQGTIALFVIISIPFAFRYAKNYRDYLFNLIKI